MKLTADNKYPTLRADIRKLKRTSSLYRLLKAELHTIGHWKRKPRGIAGYNKAESFDTQELKVGLGQ